MFALQILQIHFFKKKIQFASDNNSKMLDFWFMFLKFTSSVSFREGYTYYFVLKTYKHILILRLRIWFHKQTFVVTNANVAENITEHF
jgi:hypothetical protein